LDTEEDLDRPHSEITSCPSKDFEIRIKEFNFLGKEYQARREGEEDLNIPNRQDWIIFREVMSPTR
jgi:hypothetical protein